MRLERIPRQAIVRALHVGPYAGEARTFAAMRAVTERAGLVASPAHLEIYLSDPRRTAPARLRTVLAREVSRVRA